MYGAITGGVGTGASLTTKALGGVGKIALSAFGSGMHGLNEGKDNNNILSDIAKSTIFSVGSQILTIGGSELLKLSGGNLYKNNSVLSKLMKSKIFMQGKALIDNIINNPINKTIVMTTFFSFNNMWKRR